MLDFDNSTYKDGYDYTSQEQILARLRQAFSPVVVYEGLVDDNEAFEVYKAHEGTPVLVVNFSGDVQAPYRHKGLVGAAYDTNEIQCIVQVVSTVQAVSNRVLSKVKRVLLGFEPEGCGELTPALYSASGKINTLGTPTRYTSVQIFRYFVNSNAI